jgi:hypothetical protein
VRKIKAAIIGLGRVGFEFGLDKNRVQPASHVAAYTDLAAVNKIALCDNNTEKFDAALKALAGSTAYEFFGDINEMLRSFQPNIVSICTPTPTHAPLVKTIADCPSVKTIFLEKPIAQSLGEADEIIRACRDNDKRLAVNYSRRWSKVYGQFIGHLAPPIYMIGLHPGPLIRTGTHTIDLFNWFKPVFYPGNAAWWDNVEVQAFGEPKMAKYMEETEDFNLNGYINYGDGNGAVLLGNLDMVPQNAVVFEFTAITHDSAFRSTENGCRIEQYELRASKRYTDLNEYRRTVLSEDEPENLLLNAITQLTTSTYSPYSVQVFSEVPCSGMDARRDLQVALALHYSATHGNKPVKLADVPYEYAVRSY